MMGATTPEHVPEDAPGSDPIDNRSQDRGRSVAIGIEAIDVYLGSAAIAVEDLFRGRGLDMSRLANIGQRERSIGLSFEDPITNAVNAAKPLIDRLGPEIDTIETLVVASESGVDYSKSIASYVHEYLGLARQCRVLEVKQACYSATGIIQTLAAALASGVAPGSRALVIASDVSLVDARAQYAEPATGFGAVAVLLGERPEVLELDLGAYGIHSYETFDSARPTASTDVVDVDRSLFAYLDCLGSAFADYRSVVPGTNVTSTFSYLCMHTPFAGLVRAAHRKLMRDNTELTPDEIAADFEQRVAPSLHYSTRTGNLCAGSVYLGLASLFDHRPDDGRVRVGLFSYGSGCSSELFSGVLRSRGRSESASARIASHLDTRTLIDFATYEALLPDCLAAITPHEHRDVDLEPSLELLPADRPPLLALRKITGYHRYYEWI